jgi:hypothetical protein
MDGNETTGHEGLASTDIYASKTEDNQLYKIQNN